jgi:hypothetical protein
LTACAAPSCGCAPATAAPTKSVRLSRPPEVCRISRPEDASKSRKTPARRGEGLMSPVPCVCFPPVHSLWWRIQRSRRNERRGRCGGGTAPISALPAM